MDGNVVIKHEVVPLELSTIPSFKLYPKQVLQTRLINLKNHNYKEISLRLNKQLLIQPYI